LLSISSPDTFLLSIVITPAPGHSTSLFFERGILTPTDYNLIYVCYKNNNNGGLADLDGLAGLSPIGVFFSFLAAAASI